ncbi:hypothetical protein RHGRI_018744 [Rhododendron griersonianum]|uniref:DNA topoisomerase (ATP-hydrolyzing) n=1 Tax=Rhododendron griersonianum TaxID=479676 RepID=A0AAV6K2R4_9ERIC|nr:hypothetical protein RHGRI_018744 [Rhododendron griersonianum]
MRNHYGLRCGKMAEEIVGVRYEECGKEKINRFLLLRRGTEDGFVVDSEGYPIEPSVWLVDWLKGKIDNSSLFARDEDYDLASVGQYFNDLESHNKDIIWEDEQDGEAIELAFSKKKFEARKNWLRHFEPGTYIDQKEKLIKYSDFVYKELILFSMADLQRSIPSITSGVTSSMLLLVTWNSELPIRRWTQDYKEFLESITTGNDCPFTLVYWSV